MVFRIDRAINGLLFTTLGVVIIVWLCAEEEAWSIWPLLGAGGALIAGVALLCLAFRPARSGSSANPDPAEANHHSAWEEWPALLGGAFVLLLVGVGVVKLASRLVEEYRTGSAGTAIGFATAAVILIGWAGFRTYRGMMAEIRTRRDRS